MDIQDWGDRIISKLLNEDLRFSTLTEIKDHILSLPYYEASATANYLELPLVFDCLNSSNTEQVDLACEVLTLCMSHLPIGDTTNVHTEFLQRALIHPYPAVKLMALNEIVRDISKPETLILLCSRIPLLEFIFTCIGDDDLAVAKKASDIVTVLGLSDTGLKLYNLTPIKRVMFDLIMMNTVVRLRLYEVLINISKESDENFDDLNSTGIMALIFGELTANKDVLYRMNLVELLTQLVVTGHGYAFLEEHGILSTIFDFIDNNEDSVMEQLCEPGILKFFGNIANFKPIEVLSKYPKFFDRLFNNIESGDLTIIGVSLDTLGMIGRRNEGKCALQSTGNKITYALKTIVMFLTSYPTEVRLRALFCLENLLRIEEHKSDIIQITRRWYGLFGDNPMEVILRYSKNPFSDIKLAGLGILHAIAEQQWGQEEIKNTAGLVEFLLDRNVETDKECKQLKYQIIKTLSDSTVFDHSTLRSFQDFVKEGPFYIQAGTDVAFEGND